MMEQPLKKPLKRFMSKANLEDVLDIYNNKVTSEVAKPWFQRLNVSLPEKMLLIEESNYGGTAEGPPQEWDKPESVWKKEYEESEEGFLKEVLEKTPEIGAISEAISSNGQATMMQIIKETKELLKLLRLRKLSNNAHMMWCKGEEVSRLKSELARQEARIQAATAELRLKKEKQRNAADHTRALLGGDFVEGGEGAFNPMGAAEPGLGQMPYKGWDRLVDDPS